METLKSVNSTITTTSKISVDIIIQVIYKKICTICLGQPRHLKTLLERYLSFVMERRANKADSLCETER